MKICRLVWDFSVGSGLTYGLGPNYYHISKKQINLGNEVHIITRRRGLKKHDEEIEGIKIHRVKTPYNLNSMIGLKKLDEKIQFDIIHSHGTCGISYPFFRTIIKKPFVVHVHGTTIGMKKERFPIPAFYSLKNYIRSTIREEISILRQKFLWSHSDRVIVVSNAQKKELENWYGIKSSKIKVAYNGVDHNIFKPIKSEDLKKSLNIEGKKIVLYVGHFGLRKGISFLLQATSYVRKEEKDVFLICIGGTPKWLGTDMYWKIYEEIIKKKSLSNHVKLLGEIPHHLLPKYYSLADVFAFPSLYEAQGKVIVEAMACKLPVVTTEVGGIPEMVNDGVNGVLIPPKNSIKLSEAIINLLQDKKLAKKMGEEGRKTVESKFTWEHTVSSIQKVYEELKK